jgi:hypothetical protein
MQHHSDREAVLASLCCQEVAPARVGVELHIHRHNADLAEVTQFDAQREKEIEKDFGRVLNQVMGEARRRRWPHPFTVVVLAGPQGPLRIGPLPWEGRPLA